MAEYFPLLDRAVSALTEQTAEARRSIYERARAALLGQLRRMEPPIPEEDVARESAALDEAIARIEARFAAPTPRDVGREAANPEARRGPAPSSVRIAPAAAAAAEEKRDSPAAPAPSRSAAPASTRPAPPLPTGTAPPVLPPPSRERPVLGPRPTPGVRPAPAVEAAGSALQSRIPAVSPAQPRGTRPVMALRPVASPPLPQSGEEPSLPAAGQLPVAEAAPVPDPTPAEAGPEATQANGGFAEALDEAARRDGVAAQPAPRTRDAAARPPAPRPREPRRLGVAALAGLGVLAAVLAGIGFAAYRMRDRPEQVVASRADTAASPAPAAAGKTIDRAGDAPDEPSSGVAVTPPVGQGASDAPPSASIPVAQRAALLVDAPEEPQRVKTYVGTVVWHLDSVSPGQGQPLATAIKADIDIPDAKLKVTMLMQRNPEPQLPASHTIEFHFLPQGGNALGNVKQINVPDLRRDDDAPTGDPLAGVPVAITDNYFLVGLSRGAAETQNIRLITERNWFDVGFLFTSGKLGKLTFEKGGAGQHSFDDALKAWR